MMRTVITSPTGTGHYAQLDNVEVIGKTGTSNDSKNLLFVGCTPEYAGAMWLGYDDSRVIYSTDGWRAVASIWKTVMQDIQDTSSVLKFTPDSSVVERSYCMDTGLLATNKCTKTDIGYYRKENIPDFCTGKHEEIQQEIQDKWAAIDEKHLEGVRGQLNNR